MRILYFLNGSNFGGAGGMEYHLLDITDWMEKHGVQTACAVRKGTYLEKVLLKGKPHIYPLSWTGPAKIVSFIQVGKAIRDFAPDIISINRERDIKRIYYIASFMNLFQKKKTKIAAIFQNIGCRSSFQLAKLDSLLFINTYTKHDYIRENTQAEKKSKVIHYGIPLPDVDPLEKKRPDRKRKFFKGVTFPLIGMVGEFRKNQTELIDVAHHMKKSCEDFTIAFIGRGSPEEITPLKEKIDRLGLTKHFIFTGNVDRAQIPDVFYDLDISVSTNRAEAFGLVFIESLASYTPLVAFNSGGPVEILEKGGGILIPGGSQEMADQLCMLISDHDRRNELGQAARRVAENHFSIDAMGKNHLKHYLDLLDRN